MSKGRWEKWEEAWLRSHWKKLTDKQIAEKLGRNEDSITRKRKLLGLIKRVGRPTEDSIKKALTNEPSDYVISKLSKEERLEFYKNSFDRNWRYKHLRRVLMDNELEYYKHKYVEAIDAMDSINYVEEDLLHNMIMCDVQIVRLQEQIKNELKRFQDDDDDDTRPPPQYLYKDLNDLETRYMKYQEKLSLTRQQRLKDNRESDINIASIIQNLQDKRNRADADRLAGEMNYFKNRCKSDMDKMNFLLGGD